MKCLTLEQIIVLIKYIINKDIDCDDNYIKNSLILNIIDDILRNDITTIEEINEYITKYK